MGEISKVFPFRVACRKINSVIPVGTARWLGHLHRATGPHPTHVTAQTPPHNHFVLLHINTFHTGVQGRDSLPYCLDTRY